MLEKRSYCSNKLEELEHLKGEKVKGILQENGKTYLIFESGFGLWFNLNGVFAIELPEHVNSVLKQRISELKATGTSLERILEMAGVTP